MRHVVPSHRVTAGVVLGLLAVGGLTVSLPGNRPVGADEPAVRIKGQIESIGKAGDHTMFGGSPSRNMVNLSGVFSAVQLMPVKEGAGKEADAVVKWQADLGSRAYGGPIVIGGRVLVGTNNEQPRNPRDALKNADGETEPIDKGVVMCFDEATGKFVWQAVHDKLPGGQVVDWPKEGVCSTPVVEGNRVYYVSNQCRVVCADLNGLADGNQGVTDEKYKDPTDADVIWELDMIGELGVFPHNMSACSPVLVGDILFVITANGVDEGHVNIPAPQAPSFIAVDKNSGKVLWKRNDPGRKIMHGQWSNPTYAEIKGVRQVIFPGGDGWLYGLKPETGAPLWKFDCNPKNAKYELGGTGTRNDFIGTPVVYGDRVYIGTGQDPEHFTGVAYLWCIDPSKATRPESDISSTLAEKIEKQSDGSDKVTEKPNPNSGLVWQYGGPDRRKLVPRDFTFGRTMSTACIVDDVVYMSELAGYLHCLDAKTGKKYWQYDLKGSVWGSPYYVDGKVFVGTEGGDLYCFRHDKSMQVIDEIDNPDAKDAREFNAKAKEKRKQVEAKYLLGKSEFDAAIRSTPILANGVLFVMTEKSLVALEPKKK